MKAAYYLGDKTFGLEDVAPEAPKPGEVRLDVAYCGICGTDLHVYLGHMDGRVGNHRIIGHEMSGVISAVGDGVEDLAPGEEVVVRPLDPCGTCPACKAGHAHICHKLTFLGLDTDGAFQRQWNVPAHTVHKLPDGLSLKHASLVEPLAVACHDVARAGVKPGEDVLVIGGGPIGMLIALVARHAGGRVSVSEINEHRLAIAESLGFDTLNPKVGDVAEAIHEATGGKGADVVFEVSGSQPGVDLMTAAAATRGRICMVAIHATKPEIDLFQFFWREIQMIGARVYEPVDYEAALRLLAANKVDVAPLITDLRDLDQIQTAFDELTRNPRSMKTLIRVGEGV